MKVQYTYDVQGKIDKATGLLGFLFKGGRVAGKLCLAGWKEDFAGPISKTFDVRMQLNSVPLLGLVCKLPLVSRDTTYTCSSMAIDVPLRFTDLSGKLTGTAAAGLVRIDGLCLRVTSSALWLALLNTFTVVGTALKVDEGAPQPGPLPNPGNDEGGELVPSDQDGTERNWVKGQQIKVVWPGGKAFSFTKDNDLKVQLQIDANADGEYPRIVAHKPHDILDIFVRSPSTLCWKLYDGKINFGAPIVGERTNAGPPDHYGIVNVGSMFGKHTITIALRKSDETVAFLWDGKVVGKWPTVRKSTSTPAIDNIMVCQRRYRAQ